MHGHAGRVKRVIVECACGCEQTFLARPAENRKYIKLHQNAIVGFQKGYEPHNKGKSYIPDNIDLLIEGGKKHRFRKGQLAGDKHFNWRGGITNENNKLRNSPEYRHWRKAVFNRDNYTCVLCSKRGGDLVADHIKAWSYYPEHSFDIDNGRTLCTDCNYHSTYVLKEWQQATKKGGV